MSIGVASMGVTLVAGLSGCSFANEPPAVTVVVTETATAPPVTPAVTAEPTAAAPPPVPAEELVPNDAAPEVVEGPAVDQGPNDGAQGAVVSDGNGSPLRYTVVAGDVFFDIAQRFDLPQQQLLRMNPSVHGIGLDIYIGDVINLDWTTTK